MTDFLPDIGFGTYTLTDREECIDAVTRALDAGYRLLDTAYIYENEGLVGEALERSPVDREEVVVATKLWWEHSGYEDAIEMTRASREKLGVDTIDLLYVHWPIRTYDPAETLPALDALADDGVIDHIGFCNSNRDLLRTAEEKLDAALAAHQVECHPLLPQEDLLEYAREQGHEFVAAVPLMKGAVEDIPALQTVARRHGATPAQVALAWQIQRGVVPIPKARGAHISENYDARDIAADLTDEDVARINDIDERRRIVGGFDGAHWKQE